MTDRREICPRCHAFVTPSIRAGAAVGIARTSSLATWACPCGFVAKRVVPRGQRTSKLEPAVNYPEILAPMQELPAVVDVDFREVPGSVLRRARA